MKQEGRSVIRIGDKTDHGGQGLTATSTTIAMGKPAALQGDMTVCPQCKGAYAIKPDGEGAEHKGRSYAYDGDMTECSTKLISSLK